MEFDDLQIFLTIAQVQSISRAAASLHMGQPTVSQRLATLETEIGKALFVRHRRGVRLTEEGLVLQNYAMRMMALNKEAIDAVRSVEASRVHVKMTGPSTVNSYIAPPLLMALAEIGCDVTLKDAHSDEVMQYVLDGSSDIGFVIDVPNQPGICRIPLCKDDIICVCATGHPLTHVRREVTISELIQHQLVYYRFSYDYESFVTRMKTAYGGRFPNFIESTPAESIKYLLRQGHCVSFVPRMVVAEELHCRRFTEIQVADLPPYSWNVAMIYRDRKDISPAVTNVLSALQKLRIPK